MADPTELPTQSVRSSRTSQVVLDELQDTLEIPWRSATWQAYTAYPMVAQLLWERLKPVAVTEDFLQRSRSIAERAGRAIGWYEPDGISLGESAQASLRHELEAFCFGHSQLLLLQGILHRALNGEVVGCDSPAPRRTHVHKYRHPDIALIAEAEAPELADIFSDVKRTLDVPVLPVSFLGIAKWPDFLRSAWPDIKARRATRPYQRLALELAWLSDDAARHVHPAVWFDDDELGHALGSAGQRHDLQRLVRMLTALWPEVLLQTTMFSIAARERIVRTAV